MASLTPLSKGLIALAVVGAVASAVWHLGLKGWLRAESASPSQSGTTTPVIPRPSLPSSMAGGATSAPNAVDPPSHKAVAPLSAPVNGLSPAENSETGRKLLDSGDFAQARIHLEQAVNAGDGAAACHLGEMTLKGQGGIQANHEQAASLFRFAQSQNIICFASGK
jgi:TPR repeat protein